MQPKSLIPTPRAQQAMRKFRQARPTDDGPRLDRLYTTIFPGAQLVVDLGLAFGRVTITYPLNANPTVTIEMGPDQLPVKAEIERVNVGEILAGKANQ